jgi:hypothetical protein
MAVLPDKAAFQGSVATLPLVSTKPGAKKYWVIQLKCLLSAKPSCVGTTIKRSVILALGISDVGE